MEKCVLWLVWQNVESRQNYHIGNLYHDKKSGYYFEYEKRKEHRGLQDALNDGYQPHLAFPDLKKAYYSPFLFAAFSRRMPNPSRLDFPELLKKYGLPNDYTEMDLLRVTGGRLATDSYEFVSPVFTSGNRFGLNFYVKGWRYYEGERLLHKLTNESSIVFEREPQNDKDPFAVKILTEEKELLGYVPAYYSEFLSKVLEHQCPYDLQIDKIDCESILQLRMNMLVDGYLTEEFKMGSLENFSPVQEEFAVSICRQG